MQIVAGVLVKYVNFGKGWRHRFFVLQNGVLRYYKVIWKLAFCTFDVPVFMFLLCDLSIV